LEDFRATTLRPMYTNVFSSELCCRMFRNYIVGTAEEINRACLDDNLLVQSPTLWPKRDVAWIPLRIFLEMWRFPHSGVFPYITSSHIVKMFARILVVTNV